VRALVRADDRGEQSQLAVEPALLGLRVEGRLEVLEGERVV